MQIRKEPSGISVILQTVQPSAEKLSKVVHDCTADQNLISRKLIPTGPLGPKRHCFINKYPCVYAMYYGQKEMKKRIGSLFVRI